MGLHNPLFPQPPCLFALFPKMGFNCPRSIHIPHSVSLFGPHSLLACSIPTPFCMFQPPFPVIVSSPWSLSHACMPSLVPPSCHCPFSTPLDLAPCSFSSSLQHWEFGARHTAGKHIFRAKPEPGACMATLQVHHSAPPTCQRCVRFTNELLPQCLLFLLLKVLLFFLPG